MSAKRAAGSPLEQEVDQKPVTKQARKDDGVTEGVLEIAGRIGGEAAGSALLDETEQLFHDVIPDNHKKVVIGMVGLPARGKSFLARKLAYYLNWMEVKTEIFNHGEYRRKHLGQRQPAEFYDPKNDEGVQLRLMLARQALKDLLEYLRDGGHIGMWPQAVFSGFMGIVFVCHTTAQALLYWGFPTTNFYARMYDFFTSEVSLNVDVLHQVFWTLRILAGVVVEW